MKIGTVISTKVIQHRLILEFDLKSCKSAQNHAWLRRWRNVWTHQETCQLGNRDVEIGTFFRRIFCTTVFCSKILFGSLVENAMKKDALPQLWNSPLAKWLGSDVLHEESWTLFLLLGTTMDGEKCYFVKEQVLTLYEVHNCDIFMHDDALKHWSKMMKRFLDQKYARIGVVKKQSGYEFDKKTYGTFEKVSKKHSSSLDALWNRSWGQKHHSRLLLPTDWQHAMSPERSH